CERLDTVLIEHAGDRLINFLKIDAEGSEERIIKSTDWERFRPQVLLIEAVKPWTNGIVSDGWEPTLIAHRYRRAYFDGINLFFVREEDAELLRHFDRPVNVLDWFQKYDPAQTSAAQHAIQIRHQAQQIEELDAAARDTHDRLVQLVARLNA